ncbi:hypothetical protein [Curtobacterium sp. MCBD17_040]|uniref:hypothetical protein n=1 Tax=Curtobacterium sp. MCBD17_040 TaxID=2175674 RepID=UPI000DA993E8|nr:hypothetical protein [Curtobacterium sp. MCBD17_040]WIB65897.1 hypothetical protein DEI94_17430 [Curtobacterium sp. MCBD17_040]
MPSFSWESIARRIAINLAYHECGEHQNPVDGCGACNDTRAMNVYREAIVTDAQKKLTREQWRDVAVTVAARIRNQANTCDEHGGGKRLYADCPFCDDTKVWRMFEKKALVEGVPLPHQDFYDLLDSTPAVNVFDVPVPEEPTDR